MAFKRYERYKDSGVEWIGEIPEDWTVEPLKKITRFINGAPFKPDDWCDEGVAIVRIQNLNGSLDFNRTSKILERRYYLRNYDLLFAWSGNIGTSFGPFIWWGKEPKYYLNQHIFRLDNYDVDKQWLYWALKAVTTYVESQTHGIIGLVHVTRSELDSVKIPIGNIVECSTVALYLDQKTSEIDNLIADKEKLIQLLQEKRQAIISEAVTKGLDKNVPMKDSGVEWIGDIPEHWKIQKLNSLCYKIGDVDHKMPESIDDGIPYISPKDFTENEEIDFENAKKITQHSFDEIAKKIKPEKGDIIFARYATLGVVRLVNVDFDFLVSYSCAIIKQNKKLVNKKYLYYYLKSNCIEQEIYYYANANTQSNVGIDSIKRFKIITPPLQTQQVIADYLDRKNAGINTLIADIQTQIEKLKEYRQSLISEAVTGKIDVRDFSPSNEEVDSIAQDTCRTN
jgi:type I restriction enzyme S subunit